MKHSRQLMNKYSKVIKNINFRMDEQWLGRSCDLNCGVIGVFQGIIGGIHLEEQTITIKNVIHNGVPSKMSSVTIE